QKEGKNLKVVWNGSIYDVDSWAIPKGSPNKAEAMKFIAFASQPAQQKTYSENIAYGPSNLAAIKLIPPQIAAELPTSPQNLKGALAMDVQFWVDHGEELEDRFNAWAAKSDGGCRPRCDGSGSLLQRFAMTAFPTDRITRTSMDMTLPRNAAGQLMSLDGEPLAAQLKRQHRLKTVRALLLIAPLAVFLLAVFILPIAGLLKRAVDNPEVAGTLPHTVVALQDWNGKAVPGEPVFAALARDLERAHADKTVAQAAKRLNMEIAGSRSLLTKTARHMPLDPAAGALKTQFVDIDERWNDPAIWHAIARNGSSYTPYYLLASLDMRVGDSGQVERMSADESAYLSIFGRTLWMGVVITSLCILLGYPIAYWLANLPTRKANLLMIVVLLPFWTSVLVRVAAWIVLLQSEGLVNSGLMALGIINEPLQLAFNRIGVYVAMVHIL
ncbi:MAG: extracellular solute-binding protein, partial [Microvirgula sp.]